MTDKEYNQLKFRLKSRLKWFTEDLFHEALLGCLKNNDTDFKYIHRRAIDYIRRVLGVKGQKVQHTVPVFDDKISLDYYNSIFDKEKVDFDFINEEFKNQPNVRLYIYFKLAGFKDKTIAKRLGYSLPLFSRKVRQYREKILKKLESQNV